MIISQLPGIFRKQIVKVFIGSAASTSVKIVTGVILGKIIAEKLGPGGLGIIGQLTSFVAVAMLLASGGYQNGIISFTAINRAKGSLPEFIKPSLKLTLIISIFYGILLFALAGVFSQVVFKSGAYRYVFYCMGFTIALYSLNAYVNSFLNGMLDFKNLNILNIVNSVFSLIVSVVLIFWLGIKGALLAVVLSQTLTFLTTFSLLIKYKKIFKGFLRSTISKELILKLLPYFKMTIFSMVLLPVGQIIIRNLITKSHDNFQTGIWEAVNRVSGIYVTVVINIMLVYYLPRLSVIEKKEEILKEFRKGAFFFGATILAMGLCVFLFRNLIIKLFLSASFLAVGDLVLPQLVSDFFKILYFMLAYFAIAKSLTTYYIITEAVFFVIYISLSYFFVPVLGVKGAIYANIIMNFTAFVVHAVFIGKLYFNQGSFTRLLFKQ